MTIARLNELVARAISARFPGCSVFVTPYGEGARASVVRDGKKSLQIATVTAIRLHDKMANGVIGGLIRQILDVQERETRHGEDAHHPA